jgi:hypothetical protein
VVGVANTGTGKTAAFLIPLIHRAAQGDWTTFGRVVTGTSINALHTPAMGTYLAVTCAESVPFINENEMARETAGTFMGDYRVRVHRPACRGSGEPSSMEAD